MFRNMLNNCLINLLNCSTAIRQLQQKGHPSITMDSVIKQIQDIRDCSEKERKRIEKLIKLILLLLCVLDHGLADAGQSTKIKLSKAFAYKLYDAVARRQNQIEPKSEENEIEPNSEEIEIEPNSEEPHWLLLLLLLIVIQKKI